MDFTSLYATTTFATCLREELEALVIEDTNA